MKSIVGKVTTLSTCSLMSPTPGRMRGESVNCTADGFFTSTINKNKTAWLDSLIPLDSRLVISGTMVIFNSEYQYIVSNNFFKVNSAADQGVRVHALDNSEVTWINPFFACGSTNWYRGNDYYLLCLFGQTERRTGAWCDAPGDESHYFICEGSI